jgi:hypothetical protein
MRKLLIAATCLVLPLSALAAVKPGQWEITSKVDLGKNAPQMPQIPPEQLEKMKQMGIKMPAMGAGGAMTIKTCISSKDAAGDHPPLDEHAQRDCKVQDLKQMGKRTTLKVVCSGAMQGTGEAEFITDSPEHYTSKFHMVGTSQGHPVDVTNNAEGRWLSANCQ